MRATRGRRLVDPNQYFKQHFPAYAAMKEKISALCKQFKIDANKCNVVEETILKLIGEKPYGARFDLDPPSSHSSCYLVLNISHLSGVRLVQKLNKEYPALEARISIPTIAVDITFNGDKGIAVSMEIAAIESHLLPAVEKYLRDHPEEMNHYQAMSYDTAIIKNSINDMLKESLHGEFTMDDFIKSLWKMISEDATKPSLINIILSVFADKIKEIINEYLAIPEYKSNTFPQGMGVMGGSLERNMNSSAFTDLNIFYWAFDPVQPHKTVARFINQYVPDAAEVVDVGAPKDISTRTVSRTGVIRIQNRAFMHPGFFSASHAAIQQYAQERNEAKKSVQINFPIFNAEIITLRKVIKHLSENKDYQYRGYRVTQSLAELIDILKHYIQYIVVGHFESVEHARLREGKVCTALTNFNRDLGQVIWDRENSSEKAFDHPLTFNEIFKEMQLVVEQVRNKISSFLKAEDEKDKRWEAYTRASMG